MKLKPYTIDRGEVTEESGYQFWCRGCDTVHVLRTNAATITDAAGAHKLMHTHDGNFEQPTFSPSYQTEPDAGKRCQLFISEGKLKYQWNCEHELAGQEVDMDHMPTTQGERIALRPFSL